MVLKSRALNTALRTLMSLNGALSERMEVLPAPPKAGNCRDKAAGKSLMKVGPSCQLAAIVSTRPVREADCEVLVSAMTRNFTESTYGSLLPLPALPGSVAQ